MQTKPSQEEMELLKRIGDELINYATKIGDYTMPVRMSKSLIAATIQSLKEVGRYSELYIISQLVTDLWDQINEIEFPEG